MVFIMSAVFISGAAVMSLEILGSRVLGPFFGVTLYVWAALITVTLVALAIGYIMGGWMADRRPQRIPFYGVLILSAVAVAVIPLWKSTALNWVSLGTVGVEQAAVYRTLKEVFPQIRVFRLESSGLANFLFFAALRERAWSESGNAFLTTTNDVTAEVASVSPAGILTDDRNPTDLLQTAKAEAFRNTMVRLLGDAIFLD